MTTKLLPSIVLLLSLGGTAAGAAHLRRGPEVTFTGRVLSAESGAALPGARVAVRDTRQTTLTGADGAYRLVIARSALPGTTATLLVSRNGYESVERVVGTSADLVRTDIRLTATLAAHEQAVGNRAASTAAPEVRLRPSVAAADFAGFAPSPSPVAPHPGGRAYGWNTEQYAYIEENSFVSVANNPLSTFSTDVDRASYSNIRRFLLDGQAPPKDAVRIEEMVNYFTYNYPEPRRGEPFSITTEVTAAPWKPQHRLVRIGLQTRRVDTANLPPSNLVFLIDVSGSMQTPDKLPLVKQSLRLLVNELREEDRVAIVVYAGAAGLVLPST